MASPDSDDTVCPDCGGQPDDPRPPCRIAVADIPGLCPHCNGIAYSSVSCPCGRTQQLVPDPPTEREKIVAWLRTCQPGKLFVSITLTEAADAIERGDHLK